MERIPDAGRGQRQCQERGEPLPETATIPVTRPRREHLKDPNVRDRETHRSPSRAGR